MSGNITIDSTTKALMDDAATGEAARTTLQSDLGKYIIAEATAQCDEATAELIDCVPTDSREDRRTAIFDSLRQRATPLTGNYSRRPVLLTAL